MPINNSRRRQKSRERMHDRQMLRAAFQSLFLSVIQARKTASGYQLQQLAADTGNIKSTVSRWFSSDPPNWQIDTMADIADALDLELILQARDRKTGELHTPLGIVTASRPAASEIYIVVAPSRVEASVSRAHRPQGPKANSFTAITSSLSTAQSPATAARCA